MWILGMMFFVSCSDDDNGGTGSGNGDKDAFRDHPDATLFGIIFHHSGGFRDVHHNRDSA